jgi:hypothetical protein
MYESLSAFAGMTAIFDAMFNLIHTLEGGNPADGMDPH